MDPQQLSCLVSAWSGQNNRRGVAPLEIHLPTLAELIAVTVMNDNTSPPNWRLDALLLTVEELLVRKRGEYDNFAKVCAMANVSLNLDKVDPANLALLFLAEINGRRKNEFTNPVPIKKLFAHCHELIKGLKDGPRKKRCLSFWTYQSGVFHALVGVYGTALYAQKQISEDKSYSSEARAIAEHLALVYELWGFFQEGKKSKIQTQIRLLERNVHELKLKKRVNRYWSEGNGPHNLLQAYILANMTDGTLWNNFFKISQLADLGKDFLAVREMLEIANLARHEGHAELVKSLAENFVFIHGPKNGYTSYVELILARLYLKLGETDKAKETYQRLVDKPRFDAHMVSAVARRELDSLK